MTDYLERILGLLKEQEDQEGDWPEPNAARFSRRGAFDGTDAPRSLRAAGALEGMRRAALDKAAGAASPKRTVWEEILQDDYLEYLQDSRKEILHILPKGARNQEAAPRKPLEGETGTGLPEREILDGPAQGGGAAKGVPPLLAQLRQSRQAVGNSRRRDALRAQGQAQPVEQGWARMARQERPQTQAQDAAQLVDRAFRRDARRYDGGFTLF